jgi:hypothetical protein
MKLIYYILIISMLISGAAALSQKPSWVDLNTSQTFPTNLAMGSNDITGVGSATADEVYSGGELQRNQTQGATIVYIKNGRVIAENSTGYIIDSGIANSVDARVTESACDVGGKIDILPGYYLYEESVDLDNDETFVNGIGDGRAGYSSFITTTGDFSAFTIHKGNQGVSGIGFLSCFCGINVTPAIPTSYTKIVKNQFANTELYGIYLNASAGDIYENSIVDNRFAQADRTAQSFIYIGTGATGHITDQDIDSNVFQGGSYSATKWVDIEYDHSIVLNSFRDNYFEEVDVTHPTLLYITGIGTLKAWGKFYNNVMLASGDASTRLIHVDSHHAGASFSGATFIDGILDGGRVDINTTNGELLDVGFDNVWINSPVVLNQGAGSVSVFRRATFTGCDLWTPITALTVGEFQIFGGMHYDITLTLTGGSAGIGNQVYIRDLVPYSTYPMSTLTITQTGNNVFDVENCPAYITESSGASSVLSGQSYKDVAHGLAAVPTAQQITITLKEDFHYRWPYVDNINATHFRVNLMNGTAPEDLDFGWSID